MTTLRRVISIVTIMTLCTTAHAVPVYGDNKVQLCSKDLSNALALICGNNGGYYQPFNNNGWNVPNISGPGIVEECCHKACTFNTLALYCKGSEAMDRRRIQKRSYISGSQSITSLRDLISRRSAPLV